MLLEDSWENLNVEGFPDKDIVIRGKRRNGKERERKKNEVKGEETVFWTISEFLDTDLYLLIYLLFCFREAYKGNNNSRGWEESVWYDQVCCWHPASKFIQAKESSNKAEDYVTTAPHREQCVFSQHCSYSKIYGSYSKSLAS